MSGDTDERLQRLLGGAALADLRRRLRRHFERTDPAGIAMAPTFGKDRELQYRMKLRTPMLL